MDIMESTDDRLCNRYDFRPAGLIDPTLLAQFPTATPGDMASASWPFLRLQVPHVWRTDSRHVSSFQTGLISIEEALILHNVARGFAGHRALEIGCHFGWSSAHLAAAGLDLDIVDPALAEDDRLDFVRASLDRATAPGTARPKLWAGFSPAILEPIARSCANAYSLVFIDGNHDGDAPRRDAIAVQPFCAETAAVMFHDLNSPFVAAGLDALAAAGWKTGIYETMQIMGIAWRGDYIPLVTARDPTVPLSPWHLAGHRRLHRT